MSGSGILGREELVAGIVSHAVPTVRKTYQLEAVLGWRRPDASPDEVLKSAAEAVVRWFDDKVPGALTPSIYELKSDVLDLHLERLSTIGRLDKGLWAGRLRYADKARGGRPAVAGRTWTAEVVLRSHGGHVLFSVQMFMACRSGVDQTVRFDRPEIVPILEAELGLVLQAKLLPSVYEFKTVETLFAAVTNRERKLPVVVLSQRDDDSPSFTHTLDKSEIGRQMLGVAWVVALSRDQSYDLTDLVGKSWSVFRGAVRVYRPYLDFDEDSPLDHLLTMADRIESWEFGGMTGEAAYRAYLVEKCVRDDLCDPRNTPSPGMTYDEVSEEDRRDRRSAAEQGQLLPLAEEEIAALRLQVQALQSQVDAVSLDLEIARESLEQERAALQSQLLENDRLLGVIKERRANDRGAEPPETLQDVPDWCSRTLSGRVVLVGRAVRSLKEGTYKDVRLVAACVHALGHEGRRWLMGDAGGKAAFDARLAEIGSVQLAKSISGHRAGEQDDSYKVEYPKGSGQKRFLEWKLAKGNDMDPANCMRIYFFWDSERQVVVLGHLPGHLPNRMSN